MVYANGLSNGGGMAFVLACTLSDRIAAVGLVASAVFLAWIERATTPAPAWAPTAARSLPRPTAASRMDNCALPRSSISPATPSLGAASLRFNRPNGA